MADLIDLTFSAIIIVMNPFIRKTVMEPLSPKQPGTVATAYRTILNRMPPPQTSSSDQGLEWSGPFNVMLEQKGIAHRYRGPRNQHFWRFWIVLSKLQQAP